MKKKNKKNMLIIQIIVLIISIVLIALIVLSMQNNDIFNSSRKIAEWHKSMSDQASNHTTVAGVLAGFCITIVVLLLGIRIRNPRENGEKKQSVQDLEQDLGQATIGMFISAFLGYVGTGIAYALVIEVGAIRTFFIFSVASMMYYSSVVLSFAALLPLIILSKYDFLKKLVFIMILGAVIGGYLAASIPYYDLLKIKGCFLLLLFVSATFFSITILLFSVKSNQDTYYLQNLESILKKYLQFFLVLIIISFAISMLTFFHPIFQDDTILKRFAIILAFLFTTSTSFLCFISLFVWKYHKNAI